MSIGTGLSVLHATMHHAPAIFRPNSSNRRPCVVHDIDAVSQQKAVGLCARIGARAEVPHLALKLALPPRMGVALQTRCVALSAAAVAALSTGSSTAQVVATRP